MEVKVWNDNTLDFKQEYRGVNYHIPAGQYILMDEQEAYQFRGAYYPIIKDGAGQQTRESYKMIRIEMPNTTKKTVTPERKSTRCEACGYIAINEKDLENHIQEMFDQEDIKHTRAEVDVKPVATRGRPKKTTEEATT